MMPLTSLPAGDMRPNPAFEELAKGADLVILQVGDWGDRGDEDDWHALSPV
jgi:hypothetical protein